MSGLENEPVPRELLRFLRSKKPTAICVSGAWGTGKTFLWQRLILPHAATLPAFNGLPDDLAPGEVNYQLYSYVSLFNINSITDLKRAVFDARLPREKWWRPLTDDDVKRNWRTNVSFMGKLLGGAMRWGNVADEILAKLANGIWDQVVCIDDLERKSASLSMRDVLGFVSYLKEQRKCKVLVLTNSSELSKADRKQYDDYHEKAFDRTMVFAPTPEQCANIVEADTDLRFQMAALNLTNIRIGQKIQDMSAEVVPAIAEFDADITKRALKALTMFSWMRFATGAPPLSYLAEHNNTRFIGDKEPDEKKRAQRAAWSAILTAYGFSSADDVDEVLLKFVQDGALDVAAIKKAASNIATEVAMSADEEKRNAVWRRIRHSFEADENALLGEFVAVHKATMKTVYAGKLDRAVKLLRFMNRGQDADGLIEEYVKVHEGNVPAFDLKRQRDPYYVIDDPTLVARLDAVFETRTPDSTPIEAILRADKFGANSDEEITYADQATEDEILAHFRTLSEQDFKDFVRACFSSDSVINARPQQRSISAKARRALQRLASESRMNEWRVRTLGIPYPPSADPQADEVVSDEEPPVGGDGK